MSNIKKAIANINKKYGDGTIKMGGMLELEKIPTEIISIDRLLEGDFQEADGQ